MIEHRLIEKMFKQVGAEIGRIRNKETADPVFIDTVVDFIRTYADRTHHGKEEGRVFFPSTERYFSQSELDTTLAEFWEFDRKMIHENTKL